MNVMDTRRYEMLVRVREFGMMHADRFPSSTLGGQAFTALTAAVKELTDHAAAQVSGRGSAKEATTTKAVTREALREDIDAIVRTVRVMALDNPGLESKFSVPRARGDQALLNLARAFARDAEPMAKDFVAHHLPKDFLEDLAADIAAFEEAIRDKETAATDVVTSAASVEGAMEAGLDAVRRLDGLVTNRLRDEPAALAAYQRARHVEYGRRSKTPASPSGSVAAGPAASAQ